MDGYNDDLVMSYSIALWIRDTALRIQKDKNGKKVDPTAGFEKGKNGPDKNPYEMDFGKDKEDLTWLIK